MILVTGGTGLIGSHLLYHLVNRGGRIRATYRSEESLQKVAKVFGFYSKKSTLLMDQIEWHKADITDVANLESAFVDVEQVYHCAALISFDPKDFPLLEKINVGGTANVVNLCLKYGIKKLCHVSSIAAIGPSPKGQMATEENEWNEVVASVYGLAKYDSELEVWRGSQEGLTVVIINPGVVIGPGFWRSGSGTFFTYVAKEKKYLLPGGTGFVTVNDVVNAMVGLMSSSIQSERYILVSENWTYATFFERIAANFGVAPPNKLLTKRLLEVFWRLDWFRSTFMGKRRKLSKNMARSLQHQETYSNEKLVKALDFSFEDMNAAIARCCIIYNESRRG
jgi:nucleoside-diphosphate-sugar epimerase